ncbi:hypothetical protein D3C81_2146470 [compost metagenome]
MQQNPQRAVEARQFIHEDALMDRREFFNQTIEAPAEGRLALKEGEGDDDRQQPAEEFALMRMEEHPAGHQDLR